MYRLKHAISHCTLVVLIAMTLSGCSKDNHIYLRDMTEDRLYPMEPRATALIQPDDRLSIRIISKLPELAKPFNLSGDNAADGYTVNKYGDIQLPILGDIHVAGMSLDQLQDDIKKRLAEGNYLKDPMVTASFLNFRYTMLGAVSSNGTYSIDGDRITLLEAIAKAGDLTAAAKPDRVIVIREENDGRKMYVNDIRSTELFSSPCFYLQQNDLVYVEPKYKNKDNENRAWQFTTLAVSIAGVITSIIWATK